MIFVTEFYKFIFKYCNRGQHKEKFRSDLKITATLQRLRLWVFALKSDWSLCLWCVYMTRLPHIFMARHSPRDLLERASVSIHYEIPDCSTESETKHKTNSWTIACTAITVLICGFSKHNKSWRHKLRAKNLKQCTDSGLCVSDWSWLSVPSSFPCNVLSHTAIRAGRRLARDTSKHAWKCTVCTVCLSHVEQWLWG